MFYWRENDGAFCNTVDSVAMTFTDPYVFTPTLTNALCYSYCDGVVHMAVTGGNAITDLNYAWSTGAAGEALDSIVDLCAGAYTLIVSDDNDCRDTTTVQITEPILLEIDSLAYQPVTCSGLRWASRRSMMLKLSITASMMGQLERGRNDDRSLRRCALGAHPQCDRLYRYGQY